jgi:hypothetical protein
VSEICRPSAACLRSLASFQATIVLTSQEEQPESRK